MPVLGVPMIPVEGGSDEGVVHMVFLVGCSTVVLAQRFVADDLDRTGLVVLRNDRFEKKRSLGIEVFTMAYQDVIPT